MAPEFPKKVERLFTIGEVEDAAEEQHFLWRRGAPSGVVAVCIFRSGLSLLKANVLLLKNLLFTLLIPGTVAVYVPLRLVRDLPPPAAPWHLASLLFFATGVAIYAWCVWDFATFGRGTPAPIDAPKQLVVRGLYRYVRNPMYVGVLTTVLGWAVRYRSPAIVLYAGIVWLCFQSFIVLYEEPHLQRVFGDDYTQYRARVGRWLPRF